jgi:hypothetical protein
MHVRSAVQRAVMAYPDLDEHSIHAFPYCSNVAYFYR